jgi:hypothetical protein
MSTHKDHENEIRAEIHEAGLVGWILGYIAGEIRVLDTKQVDAALKLLNKVCSDAVQQVQAAALENVSLKVDEREPTLEDWLQSRLSQNSISKTTFQNLTMSVSFDTILMYGDP